MYVVSGFSRTASRSAWRRTLRSAWRRTLPCCAEI